MTPAYMVPPREKRAYKFSWIRVILMGLMLSGLIAVCLYLYHTAFRDYLAYLTEEEKKSTAWITEQLSYMLPFLAVAIFQYAVYAKHDNHDGVLQKERAYEILIASAVTYLLLLPLVWAYSDAKLTLSLLADVKIPKTEGKEYETVMILVGQWFLRLSIPLCLLFVYHMARAKAEVIEAKEAALSETVSHTSAEGDDNSAASISEDTAEITTAPSEVPENSAEEGNEPAVSDVSDIETETKEALS